MKALFFLKLFLLLVISSCSQNHQENLQAAKAFYAGFYNLENLFDTIDDPKIDDEEFLPTSDKKWNTQKYLLKIEHTAKVLSSVSKKKLPLIIGLCEVENKKVVNDLIVHPLLKKGNYSIIHYNSPDQRGIDPCMIYRKDYLKVLNSKTISVKLPNNHPTRDILMAEFELYNKQKLFVFINHWPSRRGGQQKSDINRITAAKALKEEVNLLLQNDNSANILIMGDFNDTPTDISILDYLKANQHPVNNELYNTSYLQAKKGIGSYNYKGNWEMIDQIIVSKSLIDKKNTLKLKENQVAILQKKWMMYQHPEFKDLRPNRTYSGNTYHAGYSDHLPVFIHLINK